MEKQKHIRLNEKQIEIVKRKAALYGISFTAALGIIITESERTAEGKTTTGGNGANHEQS